MNLELIHNFEKFLENKGYSPQTIHAYTKALEQAPDSWNVTEYSDPFCQDSFLINLSLGGKRTFL